MSKEELMDRIEYLYCTKNYESLIKACDELLEIEADEPAALNYKAIALYYLKNYDVALEILDYALKLHPKNPYTLNNKSMVFLALGKYSEALRLCDEGLKYKDFDWLWENKIRALLKLDMVDEALECFENSPFDIDIIDLMIDAGKYSQTLKYCIEEDLEGFESIIDKIKQKTNEVGDYYISWIYKIKSKSDIRICPECGGELIPIVWGLPHDGLLKKAENDEIFLGGCCLPPNPPNYHCKNCDKEFDLGVEGLHIECDDYNLYEYIEYKIKELIFQLKGKSLVLIRSFDTLKKELKGYDDREFDEFINHLKDLDYIFEPHGGYVKLVGFDDLKCMKEYCDKGKYAAPRWLVYPELSLRTMGWRMGYGENYFMNMPYSDDELEDLFPQPRYWEFDMSESAYKPVPPIGFLWSCEGKPKYSNPSEGLIVNDFITLDDEKEFQSDIYIFKSINDAINRSKSIYFDMYGHDAENLWESFRYSVLLNASYFKIMQDEELKEKLLKTGNKPLIYESNDEENLFGRALMELRDEIRRLSKNEDLIDWEYTEYLKYIPWLD